MGRYTKHPFWQSLGVVVVSYVLIRWGIAYLPGLVGVTSAPVPASVVLQYTVIVLVGVLVWVSDNEERWQRFKEPIHAALVEPEKKVVRMSMMAVVPLLVAFATFNNVRPTISAPASLRSIHPAPRRRSPSGERRSFSRASRTRCASRSSRRPPSSSARSSITRTAWRATATT